MEEGRSRNRGGIFVVLRVDVFVHLGGCADSGDEVLLFKKIHSGDLEISARCNVLIC